MLRRTGRVRLSSKLTPSCLQLKFLKHQARKILERNTFVVQRKPWGEIFLTFRTHKLCNAFLEKSSFVCHQHHFTANEDERPLTLLTIYDAPYELSDSTIIHHLSPYHEVVWYRCRTFRAHHGVFNGLRHYCVQITHAILSYLRFGKFQIRLYHDGQIPTCRRCN